MTQVIIPIRIPGDQIVTTGAATAGVALPYSRTDHGPHSSGGATLQATTESLGSSVALSDTAQTSLFTMYGVGAIASMFYGYLLDLQLVATNAAPSINNWSIVTLYLIDVNEGITVEQIEVPINSGIGVAQAHIATLHLPTISSGNFEMEFAAEITTLAAGDAISASGQLGPPDFTRACFWLAGPYVQ